MRMQRCVVWVVLAGCGSGEQIVEQQGAVTAVNPALGRANVEVVPSSFSDPDYLPGPLGFVHKSCVYEVDDDATIDEVNGTIEPGNGKAAIRRKPCAFPLKVVASDGVQGSSGTVAGGISSAWLLYSWQRIDLLPPGNHEYNKISGSWTVPDPPASCNAGSLLASLVAFFNGLQSNVGGILQPVLQYGAAANGGGCYWSVGNWYVAADNSHVVSTPRQVSPGTQITGLVSLLSQSSPMNHWIVYNQVGNTGAQMNVNLPMSNVFNWAFPGVLEVYNIPGCSFMPPGSISFQSAAFYDGPYWNTNNYDSTAFGTSGNNSGILFLQGQGCPIGMSASIPWTTMSL